ncbi:MAG: 50S ribosomal protein L20, partial [Candidatus Omnitrophica bacterium]|nr:50S ribosomal protein L20 [Candidatus Omnitrophota bacterium]
GLKKIKVLIDRKILAELAVSDKKAFTKLVETVKA